MSDILQEKIVALQEEHALEVVAAVLRDIHRGGEPTQWLTFGLEDDGFDVEDFDLGDVATDALESVRPVFDWFLSQASEALGLPEGSDCVWLRLYLGQDGTETWTVFQLFAVVPGGGCPNHKRERLDGCDDCDRDKEWDRGWLGPEAASFSGMIEALRLEASSWRDEVYNREDVQEDGQ